MNSFSFPVAVWNCSKSTEVNVTYSTGKGLESGSNSIFQCIVLQKERVIMGHMEQEHVF